MTPFYKQPKVIIWSIVTVILLIIILQNVEPTQIDLLFWSLPEIPKLVLILISMAIGSLATVLISWELKSRKKAKDMTPSI